MCETTIEVGSNALSQVHGNKQVEKWRIRASFFVATERHVLRIFFDSFTCRVNLDVLVNLIVCLVWTGKGCHLYKY